MKRFIVNEDWETIEVEDTSSFFVLIFKQGTAVAGYIKKYSVDDTAVLAEYESLISQYAGVKFVDPASILVIKVPATGQVKAMLEEAEYVGDETNKSKLEIINHLISRADCEIIEEKVLMTLEEAKKKKKKKKKSTSKVTYLTGFPWLNDHRFNHAMGDCDCGKDAADDTNDAIGGGESIGDAGSAGEGSFGGESAGGGGGGMGESLVKEALTPLQKMQALENGTRGFNAAAASDQKLLDNLLVCAQNNLSNAGATMIGEIARRMKQGTWQLGPVPGIPTNLQTSPQSAPVSANNTASPASLITISEKDIHPSDFFFIRDNRRDTSIIISNITSLNNALEQAIITLLFAVTAGYTEVVQAVKSWILSEITKEDFKQIIADCKTNTKLLDRITSICNEFITEGINKMNTLTEAKRYIKRYYIRPQNVFASNKAEILQRLAEVEADGANCSVYSLKALDDHDDVHLLQPKDIIYYYDGGVLYDKNHVPVLDYDLNVKNEEERPKISADATSDERFKDVYQDRMTDRTFAEALEEDFYMDFDDVNVYGVKLKEGKEAEYTCCICGDEFEGYGNNPAPYKESGKCCDACNRKFVIPARLAQIADDEE